MAPVMSKACLLYCVLLLWVSSSATIRVVQADPQVPCYFIFGDSLVDNGNNNAMASLARANYLPYGIDFPDGPTGRFCNGETTTDIIAKLLGFEDYSPPPYANAKDEDLLRGVNFASAAAGIRDETGQQLTLYNYGARKVAVIGIGEIGCSPSELAQNSPDGHTCVERIDSANRMFNDRLISLVDNFNNNFEGAKFIYVNVYGIFDDILKNPSSYGFTVTNEGCCGTGRNNGQITCLPLQTPCPNRNQYMFWDAFHPTAAANVIIGKRSYSAASPSDAYPMDISRLAQL
ncbi:GDSL esterase/lipase At5g45670-like isoform X2 [Macadamia integrifolia]|uniref:GDSL esterase/lipase At5g45670-like isoform X2 n=1 Tax=Macadamia integrifolia TaxID=60698 RepID=UPI001C4E88CD|nr:GDSL esterase/lipase At5g45670-like isoform X2 [Macadamia integrifolia]